MAKRSSNHSNTVRGVSKGRANYAAVLSVVHIMHYLYLYILYCVAQPMVLVHGMVFSPSITIGVGRAFYLTLCTELKCLL